MPGTGLESRPVPAVGRWCYVARNAEETQHFLPPRLDRETHLRGASRSRDMTAARQKVGFPVRRTPAFSPVQSDFPQRGFARTLPFRLPLLGRVCDKQREKVLPTTLWKSCGRAAEMLLITQRGANLKSPHRSRLLPMLKIPCKHCRLIRSCGEPLAQAGRACDF